MILLQNIINNEILPKNSSVNDFWFNFEIVIIIGVIAYQLYHSYKVYGSISKLSKIFNFRLILKNGYIEKEKIGKIDVDSSEIQYEDEFEEESFAEIVGDDIIKLSLVDTMGKNKIIVRIKNALNTYLINNYGAAVNFSIIKDLIDREVEIKDEEITQTITTPLYFGLAATMIGIIFGLMAMPSLDGDGFTEGVNALIRGVKWAMWASLSGLACTTVLSSFFYKSAKEKVLREKNAQLSYLQAKLLPELIKAEDTGVSGLKASLDRFARVATSISDNVLIAANQTGENLVLQQEVIDKVENIGVLRISKINLEIFDKLDKNLDAFYKFSSYIASMEKTSSNLLEFASRTSNIDRIIQEVGLTLKDSKQLFQFLSSHFDKIEDAGNAALKSVGIAESHFEEAIESLKTRTDEMITQLYKGAAKHEAKSEGVYKEIRENIDKIASKYINEFSIAYADSIPNFEQLDNLGLLPKIKEEFLLKATDFQNESGLKTQALIEIVNELNSSLKSVHNNLNSQTIISKLESIDEKLKRRTNKNANHNNSQSTPNRKVVSEDFKDNSLSIGKVIKKLF